MPASLACAPRVSALGQKEGPPTRRRAEGLAARVRDRGWRPWWRPRRPLARAGYCPSESRDYPARESRVNLRARGDCAAALRHGPARRPGASRCWRETSS